MCTVSISSASVYRRGRRSAVGADPCGKRTKIFLKKKRKKKANKNTTQNKLVRKQSSVLASTAGAQHLQHSTGLQTITTTGYSRLFLCFLYIRRQSNHSSSSSSRHLTVSLQGKRATPGGYWPFSRRCVVPFLAALCEESVKEEERHKEKGRN